VYKLLIISSDGPFYRESFLRETNDLDIHLYKADSPESAAFAREMNVLYAWKLPPERLRTMVAEAPNLTWVQSTGAGVDHIMAAAPLPDRVLVTRTIDIFGPMMAEYVLGYLLAVTLEIPKVLSWQREKHWGHVTPPQIRGNTAVVVGLGNIGSEVAGTLRAAGLHVIGVSRTGTPSEAAHETLPVSRLDEVLPRADVLVLVAPLTDQTRGLIDKRRLGLLPRHARVINAGRGAVVVEADLIAALQNGTIAGAILDVFEREPLPADNPLWELPNVIVTPHVSGPDDIALNSRRFLENFARFKAGQPLAGVVDLSRGY
jgi:phosphoglycerate dehydrogenase-like enzyme